MTYKKSTLSTLSLALLTGVMFSGISPDTVPFPANWIGNGMALARADGYRF